MSEKGGKKRDDEIVDFEDSSSEAVEKARKRVEAAEKAALAEADTDSSEDKCENVCYKSSRLKIVVFSALGYMLGIAFILALVLLGIRIGQTGLFLANQGEGPKETVEVLSVENQSYKLSYKIAKPELSTETGSYLADVYGSGKNYAVIKSKTQLSRLESIYRGYAKDTDLTSLSEFTDTDDSFFGAGSIIAIPYESQQYASAALGGIYRNESYEITATVNPINMPRGRDNQIYGTLILIKVNNIQPRIVTVSEGDPIEIDTLDVDSANIDELNQLENEEVTE